MVNFERCFRKLLLDQVPGQEVAGGAVLIKAEWTPQGGKDQFLLECRG